LPRDALPSIADVKLTDYKVRVLDFKKGTAARVRVLVEWSDSPPQLVDSRSIGKRSRKPAGSPWVDALRLELMRITKRIRKSIAR